MKLKDKILNVILNNKYFKNLMMEDTEPVILEPIAGLYDANDNLICTWEESGLDVSPSYHNTSNRAYYYKSTGSSGYCVLNKYPNTRKVIIPSNQTYIGSFSFCECRNITSVLIPVSVTSIGDAAFSDCNSLKTIYYTGTQAQWNAVTKGSVWSTSSPTVVYEYKQQ